MDYDKFISRLQGAYNKKYNEIQIQDIIDFLEEYNISEERCKHIYNLLVDNNKFLPKRSDIKEIFEHSKSSFYEKNENDKSNKQSPINAVIEYQDYGTEWLIQKCDEIRALDRDLIGKEISFITYWESLKNVPFEYRNLMKQYIIQDDRKAIFDLIDAKGYKQDFKKAIELKNIS